MKAKLIGWLEETRGSYGETVFKKKGGQTQITRKPRKRTTLPTEAQVATQERFKMARDYYEYVQLKPELLALYERAAEETGKSVYMMCREDWYKPPEVTGFIIDNYNGKIGDQITFSTRDEIGVPRAVVTISDEDEGTVLEQGEAVPEVVGAKHAGFWIYTATKAVPAGKSVIVEIEAYGNPGNKGQMSGEKRIL